MHGLVRVVRQSIDTTVAGCHRELTLLTGQRRKVEQLGQPFAFVHLDEQGTSACRQRDRQRRGGRGLAGAAPTGDDVQPPFQSLTLAALGTEVRRARQHFMGLPEPDGHAVAPDYLAKIRIQAETIVLRYPGDDTTVDEPYLRHSL